jgi:hypothetical protein
MHIANPIYDVVFKFMMEDEKVAKLFLSAIIGEKVVSLDFSAQEHTRRKHKDKAAKSKEEEEKEKIFFTVCHFDFSAQIDLGNGKFKTVMIELQKAKFSSDIMRFRRYLGLHYQNAQNTYKVGEEEKARQIYCIFLLGHEIFIPNCPIAKVDYQVQDVTTQENLNITNEFVESLHHLSWIVQIRQLKSHRRNNLEKLLSIFDQDNITKNHHILNVNEDEFPEEYRSIVRRLRMASESEDIQIEMQMEDDFLKELEDKERKVAQQEKVIEEHVKTIGKHVKAIKEKNKLLKEKDKVLKEKDKALEELKKQLEELKKQK